MKQNTYTIASPVPEEMALFDFLQLTREKLLSKGISHEVPKLGWHISPVTSFEATPVEPIWFLLGLAMGSMLYSHNGKARLIRTIGFDFFDGPHGSKTLILRLETDEEFREMISNCRAVIQQLTSVMFTAKNFQANFHVTVAEWILPEAVTRRRVFWEQLFASHKVPIVTEVERPKIYLRDKNGWTPVVI